MTQLLDLQPPDPSTPRVEIVHGEARIHSLSVDDPLVVSLLEGTADEARVGAVAQMVTIGARGLATMGIGLDVTQIDQRVQASVDHANALVLSQIEGLLNQAREEVANTLDPARRGSLVARMIEDFSTMRETLLAEVDPDRKDSHFARLLDGIDRYLGPTGALASQLTVSLDPGNESSGIAAMARGLDRRFTELRDLIIEERGRKNEAEYGTRKGLDFEDRLESDLRQAAKAIGALVERTSTRVGGLSATSKVGDYVVELEDGTRIVVEAKNTRSITLLGADGMLAELDRAMANRNAELAICISGQDAYPAEVGGFGVYGDRLLIVDDGEGVMVGIALRWARAWARTRGAGVGQTDLIAVAERLGRIRQLAQHFSSNKRTLSDISSNVDRVRSSLDSMRSDMLEIVDDVSRLLRPTLEPGQLVEIERQAG